MIKAQHSIVHGKHKLVNTVSYPLVVLVNSFLAILTKFLEKPPFSTLRIVLRLQKQVNMFLL